MIRPGEPNDYASEILFYLPQVGDPSLPLLGHVFTLGEVRIKIDAAWNDVTPLSRIVERGHGWYAIQLTPSQRAIAREIAYEANCAAAQPDRGVEIVGELSGDIAEGSPGVLPFFLPDEDDPINGPPVEGHVFTLGEVELSLPDGAFAAVDPLKIIEYGAGLYGVMIDDASQTTKRGKAIVVANVAGAQRYSGYRTILGAGTLVIAPPLPVPLSGSDLELDQRVSGDLALTWSNATADADLSTIVVDASGLPADLATDRGLTTAVILSLFTDRRAADDDVPPSGDPTDRRGWWADEFLEVPGDRYGSRLWLLARAKRTNETVLRAKEYISEALAWMLEDRVASAVEALAKITTEPMVVGGQVVPTGSLLLGADIHRPGRDPVSYRFAHTWDHMQESA